MNWYKNKRIVITGATSGIGKLLMEKLADGGATVVAAGRNITEIEETHNIFPAKCDVSVPAQLDELFDFAYRKMGGIDIFFANAGFGYCELLRQPDWDHINSIFKTNVYAPMYGLEKMIQLTNGEPFSYVITASGVAQTPMAGFSLYTSTKFAIDGFVQTMQLDLPESVHLCTVYPVAVKTRFFSRSGKDAPVPIFRQSKEATVNAILKGVARKKKYIRPLPIFNFTVWFMRVFPFVGTIGLRYSGKAFRKWAEENK